MGKQASVQLTSAVQLWNLVQSLHTIQPSFRIIVAILLLHLVVGCRAPWINNSDNYNPLVVAEKSDTRNPRAFASSRLRPTPNQQSLADTRPDAKSQTISDDRSVDLDVPAEHQELFKRQLQALESKNFRKSEATEVFDADAQAESAPESDGPASFSLSDEHEAESDAEPIVVSAPTATAKTLPALTVAAKPSSAKPRSNKPTGNKPSSQESDNAKPIGPPISSTVASQSRVSDKLSDQQSSRAATDTTAPVQQAANRTPQADQAVQQAQVVTAKTSQPVKPASAETQRNNVRQADVQADVQAVGPADGAASQSTDWRDLARQARQALREEAQTTIAPSPEQKLAMEAKHRLLSLVVDDLESSQEPIEFLQPNEKEYFREQFLALYNAIDPKGNPVWNRRWTLALQNQRKAQSHLAAVSNLEIQNTAFCTEVDSFGITAKFPQYHFRQDQELLLYCELENFVAEPVKNGPTKDGYETQLQGSYEIVDSNGRRVADQLLPKDEHVCSNKRRDYFIAYRIYMPQEIKPGRYQLKLTIEDMKAHKFGQSTVDFQIVQ